MSEAVSQVSIDIRDDSCELMLSGRITPALALNMDGAFKRSFGYYRYAHLTIKIESPGGDITALRHIVECMRDWRSRGYRISTQGCFTVASAGALLLALGDVGNRSVYPYTDLLFHGARATSGASTLTAAEAFMMTEALKTHDEAIIMLIVEHIVLGFGGANHLRKEGMARCDHLLRELQDGRGELRINSAAKSAPWLEALSILYSRDMVDKGLLALTHHLEQRLHQDRPMDVWEAYCLCLLDWVGHAPHPTDSVSKKALAPV